MRAAILGQFDILNRAIVTLDRLCAARLSQTEAGQARQAIAEGLYAAITIGAYHPDAPRTPPTRAANNVVRHGFETPGCACSGGQG